MFVKKTFQLMSHLVPTSQDPDDIDPFLAELLKEQSKLLDLERKLKAQTIQHVTHVIDRSFEPAQACSHEDAAAPDTQMIGNADMFHCELARSLKNISSYRSQMLKKHDELAELKAGASTGMPDGKSRHFQWHSTNISFDKCAGQTSRPKSRRLRNCFRPSIHRKQSSFTSPYTY